MQDKMQEHARQYEQQQQGHSQNIKSQSTQTKPGDYIEFEEIK